jgi:hypothetical protein
MRQSVVVDGVTLTRDQVEKAKKELDKPEYPLFKGGNIVKDKFGGTGGTYLVLADAAQKALTANYGYSSANFGLGKRYLWLAALDTGYAFYCPANDVIKVL